MDIIKDDKMRIKNDLFCLGIILYELHISDFLFTFNDLNEKSFGKIFYERWEDILLTPLYNSFNYHFLKKI